MQREPLQLDEVDALLVFLDGLQNRTKPFAEWHGGRQPDGSFRMPAPIYAPDVVALFHELERPCWQDPDYNLRQAGKWLDHPHFIATAGYDRIRTMLTYCRRGEAQAAGHWERMLASGKLIAILQRLRDLRLEFPQTPAGDPAAMSQPSSSQPPTSQLAARYAPKPQTQLQPM